MPHARRAHHPRSASNSTNPPDTTSRNPIQVETLNANHAPTNSPMAPNPRISRPLLLMLGEKNRFIALLSLRVCGGHPRSSTVARGLSFAAHQFLPARSHKRVSLDLPPATRHPAAAIPANATTRSPARNHLRDRPDSMPPTRGAVLPGCSGNLRRRQARPKIGDVPTQIRCRCGDEQRAQFMQLPGRRGNHRNR